MTFWRKIFGSGIVDDEAEEHRRRAQDAEQREARNRDAMYHAVIQADQSARVFRNAAGEMRMMRGER